MTTGTVRPLTEAEAAAFRLGRLIATQTCPYFAHALFAVSPLSAPGLGTFGVDRWWRLYMDPDLLTGEDAWTPATVGAVLLHEVGHLIRDHAERITALNSPQHHLAWNLSTDAEINDDLIAAGIALPEGVVTPAALGLPDNDLAKTYYRLLLANEAGGGLPDDGGPGCGSGAGTAPMPGELPESVDAGDGAGVPVSAAEADLIRRRVATDVQQHSYGGQGRGSVPAGLVRWADGVLAPAKVPWRRLLRAGLRRCVGDAAGLVNYSYTRPARRQVPKIVRPAMRRPVLHVALVVDTSGSMSAADLAAAMSEVDGVLRQSGIGAEHVRLLSCDAGATSAKPIRSVRDVQLVGGGGTDMRVGISEALAARPLPDVVIVLTDGYTPWPDRQTRARLVCVLIGDQPPVDATPAWAVTVTVPTAGRR